ncbi:LADA_0F10858g1_1 [Lachancea dasiensis]|uniref:Coatomer subunit epsilon n=1 Tax=Lachancea dasiensis TaxID=1072105 RepID=A0A1G4JM17_9SACH|nr:LADA_0F10858g1_1 [Lachancea dasiensis]
MDLFAVKQQYYTGNYKEALSRAAQNASESSETVEFYRTKCQQALGQLDVPNSATPLGAVFTEYFASAKGGDLSKLEKAVAEAPSSLFVVNVWATAQARAGELEKALKTCTDALEDATGPGAVELALLAVQIAVVAGQKVGSGTAGSTGSSAGARILQNFLAANDEYPNEDEIVVNMADSYVNFALGRETSGSNFYFYEELCQTLPCWKSQLGLLSLHLQQQNLPEAQAVVELLESEFYQNQSESAALYTPELLANKVTLAAMHGEHPDAIRAELLDVKPEHPLSENYRVNDAKFDEIVAKYGA